MIARTGNIGRPQYAVTIVADLLPRFLFAQRLERTVGLAGYLLDRFVFDRCQRRIFVIRLLEILVDGNRRNVEIIGGIVG